MTNQPADKFKNAMITATIWDNNSFYSVDLSRSYRTCEGERKSTISFGHKDLLNLAKCAERAENWISRKTAATS